MFRDKIIVGGGGGTLNLVSRASNLALNPNTENNQQCLIDMNNPSRKCMVIRYKTRSKRTSFIIQLSTLQSDYFFYIKQTMFIILFAIYLFASTVFLKAQISVSIWAKEPLTMIENGVI